MSAPNQTNPIPALVRLFALPLVIGAAGGGLFALLGLPAGWMSGSMIAATAFVMAGQKVDVPSPLRIGTLMLMGLVMGSSVTPETFRLMAAWPVSMAGLAVLVPAIIAVITVYLVRVERWDRASAFYASIPGAMSYVLAMTSTSKADTRGVVITHGIRLALLIAVLPGLVVVSGHGTSVSGAALPIGSPVDYLILLAVSAGLGLAAERFNVPGGAVVGAMFGSALLHGTGLSVAALPPFLIKIGAVLIGLLIAERFNGTTAGELGPILRPAFGAFVVGTTTSVAVAALFGWIAGVPIAKMMLAYAPGAIEAISILAYVLAIDPAFVSAHHVVRFMALALVLPLIARLVLGPESRTEPSVSAGADAPHDTKP